MVTGIFSGSKMYEDPAGAGVGVQGVTVDSVDREADGWGQSFACLGTRHAKVGRVVHASWLHHDPGQ